ncbi:transmembrane protein 87A-like [Actinia tenebrosa]|uniref:Transmembrane protein 87A-like n=1 Tax=Actinia tenebrosa TaxID=6105 RepID=A0A6P8J0T7_ACTTE|nr:transmembrane protein 87A-like [Actinia tenebrosa]
MAAFRLLLVCSVLLVFPISSDSLPEPGKQEMVFPTSETHKTFSKALYEGTTISVKGSCSSIEESTPTIKISWKLIYSQCAEQFMGLTENMINVYWDKTYNHEIHGEDTVICNNNIHLSDMTSQEEYNFNDTLPNAAKFKKDNDGSDQEEVAKPVDGGKTGKPNPGKNGTQAEEHSENNNATDQRTAEIRQERSAEMEDKEVKTLLRVKRDNEVNGGVPASNTKKQRKSKKTKNQKKESNIPKTKKNPKSSEKSRRIALIKRDGIYMLIVTVMPVKPEKTKESEKSSFHLKLEVAMESKSGYLSATDWPLLPFYGVMSLVYLFYGIIWLIVSACQWRDLLRIQFWIGGVIALGMLEKAVFYSEYNNVNNTGVATPGLVVFAEIISVAKRTLARMLVIIVSMGFGIVKPRLGKSLHRVLVVGALYFIIGIVEGYLRSHRLKADPSKEQLIAGIPLAVLDAAICWWIFMSLVQTTRTLRIRRNVIKLSLYRHFTNTLIFAVLASVAYMIWSIKTHKFAECIKDWSELWLDEAFWHFLFSIILLVIMVLWRPTANNQRYAFTPIVDFDEDEEDNVTLSEAFDGMKMRNTRTEVIVDGDSKKKAEDDLKWVEENIPSSAADAVLPSVLDSDEELMTTKFEMSKME